MARDGLERQIAYFICLDAKQRWQPTWADMFPREFVVRPMKRFRVALHDLRRGQSSRGS